MKKNLTVLFILCSCYSFGQRYQSMPQPGYGPIKRMLFERDGVISIPIGIEALRNITGGRDTAQLRYVPGDSSLYVYTGSTWRKIGGDGAQINIYTSNGTLLDHRDVFGDGYDLVIHGLTKGIIANGTGNPYDQSNGDMRKMEVGSDSVMFSNNQFSSGGSISKFILHAKPGTDKLWEIYATQPNSDYTPYIDGLPRMVRIGMDDQDRANRIELNTGSTADSNNITINTTEGNLFISYLDIGNEDDSVLTYNTTTGKVGHRAMNKGTVTSVGSGYGLSGGPITTTGTLFVDTLFIASKTYVGNYLSGKLNISDTIPMLSGYLRKNEQWVLNGSNIHYSAGNVGINTASPSFPLDVNGNIRTSGTLSFTNTAVTNVLSYNSGSGFAFSTSLTLNGTTTANGAITSSNKLTARESLSTGNPTIGYGFRAQTGSGSWTGLTYNNFIAAVTQSVTNTGTMRGFYASISGTFAANGNIGFENTGGDNFFNSGGTSSSAFGVSNATGINASAAVQIDNTTKGFLLPRQTTSQRNAISSPATGLQVYDTDLKRPVWYDGTAWKYSAKVFTGTAAPATTPEAVGDTFTDTVNLKMYVATGTASSADWTILN